jgi:hypothetical protein
MEKREKKVFWPLARVPEGKREKKVFWPLARVPDGEEREESFLAVSPRR